MKTLCNNTHRHFRRLIALAGLMLGCAGLGCSGTAKEDVGNTNASLRHLVDHAVVENASLNAARLRWEAARQAVVGARGWPDPKLTYGYFAEPVETRVGPQEHRIGIMQPLLWFGRLKAAGDVASQEAAAALAEFEASKLAVVRQVKDTWYELQFLDQSMKITRDNLDLLKQLEAVAQTQFRSGGSMSPVNKAQVEFAKLQDRLISLRQMRKPLESRMNALLNRPQHTPLPETASPAGTDRALPENEVLFARQAQASPILAALSSRIDREDHAIGLARREGMPNLGLGVDYIVTGPARVAGTPDSGRDAVIAMVSVDIPLWRGKHTAAVAEARARRDAAESEYAHQSNELAAQLEMALYRHRDAERKARLYSETLLPQARSAFNVARQGYEAGSADFLDLIDAQRVQLEIELERERAVANREQARATVEMLVGQELSTSTNTANKKETP